MSVKRRDGTVLADCVNYLVGASRGGAHNEPDFDESVGVGAGRSDTVVRAGLPGNHRYGDARFIWPEELLEAA